MTQAFYPKSDLEVVDLPRRDAANTARPCDTVKVSEIGGHIVSQCSALLDRSLPAHEEFAHWHGALSGAGMLDAATEKQFSQFSRELAKSADQKLYFNQKMRPALYGLRPQPRKGA